MPASAGCCTARIWRSSAAARGTGSASSWPATGWARAETAAFELTAHVTGRYLPWWMGYQFEPKPLNWTVASDTQRSTRDGAQELLFGPAEGVKNRIWRGGMIPIGLIEDVDRKNQNVPNCIDTAYIRHASGERHHGAPIVGKVRFLSYDAGRDVFQAVKRDGVWLDEEPPDVSTSSDETSDIYSECRRAVVPTDGTSGGGIMMCTWTPLRGRTKFIQDYIERALMLDPADGRERPAAEVMARIEAGDAYQPRSIAA